MFRRFSINFAIFSIFLDGIIVVFALAAANNIRPLLNVFPFAEELYKHYPLRDWTIVVDFRSGVVIIRGADVSAEKGYVVHLTNTMQELRQKMKFVGGEILERGGLSRAKVVDPEDAEDLPRDFRDEVRTADTDAPEEEKIRAQRSANPTG